MTKKEFLALMETVNNPVILYGSELVDGKHLFTVSLVSKDDNDDTEIKITSATLTESKRNNLMRDVMGWGMGL